jgi:hypothetical protein
MYSPAGDPGKATITGSYNTALGQLSGAADNTDPSEFVAIGYYAMAALNSIAIGSGSSAAGAGSIALGRNVTTSVAGQMALGTSAQHILLKTDAAPADAALAANQFTLWLDATNGAAKLMVKAKSANGTVVYGSVALA